MQRGFTKLFNTIVTSTIWREDNDTRILWITMLAIADRYGEVSGSVPGMAHIANISEEGCRRAITKLESPDPDSRTPDYEGRRIEKIDGGWHVLNYELYRKKLSADELREYKRIKQAEYRKRQKARGKNVEKSGQTLIDVDTCGHNVATVQEYKSTQSTRVQNNPPTPLSPKAGVAVKDKILTDVVMVRYREWMNYRREDGSRVKNWDALFARNAKWLSQFSEVEQIEIIEESMRRGWKALIAPRRDVQRQLLDVPRQKQSLMKGFKQI